MRACETCGHYFDTSRDSGQWYDKYCQEHRSKAIQKRGDEDLVQEYVRNNYGDLLEKAKAWREEKWKAEYELRKHMQTQAAGMQNTVVNMTPYGIPHPFNLP